MIKKIEVKVFLREDTVKYLSEKFKTNEEIHDYLDSLVRAEIEIDQITPEKETPWYRFIRKKVKALSDAGKELTSEVLAQNPEDFSVQSGRDWLHRMNKDGYVELVERKALERKSIVG
jgi:hypothetical protein